MRVIGLHVEAIVPERNSAIHMTRSIIDQSVANCAAVVPDYAASTGIQRKGVVCGSHKHHSIHDNRGNLEVVRVVRVKYPLRAKLANVLSINLRERTVAAPR